MCGRFTLMLVADDLREAMRLGEMPADWQPRFNIAPSQMVAVVVDGQTRAVQQMRWGLVPSWAKDITIGSRLINARSETVTEKPSFRDAFSRRRCLVLADGFYEWQRQPASKGPSVPYHFHMTDHSPFAFAGLWEVWRGEEGKELRTCTLLTTQANAVVAPVHERMPVILDRNTCWKWLEKLPSSDLVNMLGSYSAVKMAKYPVSRLVNDPNIDQAECAHELKI